MRMKKDINIQIGEQIKKSRELAKLTQEQLAERIDVSPQFVSDLERGVVGVSILTLKRVCSTLGVSSDQILFGYVKKDRVNAIADKCECLTDEQFAILSEIFEKIIQVINTENSNSFIRITKK